jgi:hypothetical protein
MLHIPDCEHFYDDLPPREATPEELTTLPVCSDCEARLEGPRSRAASVARAGRFVCPTCNLTFLLGARQANGLCVDRSSDE